MLYDCAEEINQIRRSWKKPTVPHLCLMETTGIVGVTSGLHNSSCLNRPNECDAKLPRDCSPAHSVYCFPMYAEMLRQQLELRKTGKLIDQESKTSKF